MPTFVLYNAWDKDAVQHSVTNTQDLPLNVVCVCKE